MSIVIYKDYSLYLSCIIEGGAGILPVLSVYNCMDIIKLYWRYTYVNCICKITKGNRGRVKKGETYR